jgi:predicted nucleic acid-binding protein
VNVYVESNFVLELALLQEQHAACEEILYLCESGRARLVVPAYCLMEPYEPLVRRQADRRQLKSTLDSQFRQIVRTALYRDRLLELETATALLLESATDDLSRLETVRSRLLAGAEVAPLEGPVLARAVAQRATRELTAQDAVVYASILVHLERTAGPSCFVTSDSDFGDPNLKRELNEHNCRLLIGFEAGLQFLRRPPAEGTAE